MRPAFVRVDVFDVPIAQLVEHWVPGLTVQVRAARNMVLLAGMVHGLWQRPRLVEVGERVGRVRLCGHVKVSTLNSAVIQESMSGCWESVSQLGVIYGHMHIMADG